MKITISPTAAKQLNGRTVRIAYTTGCGGSGYRLSFAAEPMESDEVVAVDGVRVALDPMAASHLDGAHIDYDPAEDGYLLEHPNAVEAVWCG